MSHDLHVYGDPKSKPPLDISLYSLNSEELTFFRRFTGIENEEELKNHILSVQSKAYEIYGYPCIRRFDFLRLRMSKQPAYSHAIKIAKEREDVLLLDLGCCLGTEVRKAVLDGWPVNKIVATDLRKEFWECGHQLFKSTSVTFPVGFVAGNIFDDKTLDLNSSHRTPLPLDLSILTSLTPLIGETSVIHATLFFHLFNEEEQSRLAHRIAKLLSPLPGSIIFGTHNGQRIKGLRKETTISNVDREMFCHSPESWIELWNGDVFERGTVKVEAWLDEVERTDLKIEGEKFYLLVWSVERL